MSPPPSRPSKNVQPTSNDEMTASAMPKSSSGASAAHSTNNQNQRSEDIYVVPAAVSAKSSAFVDVVIPQNPGLAENTYGSPHCDSYCSESANTTGPNATTVRVIRQRNPYGVTFVMVSNQHNQQIGISLDWSAGTFYLVIYSKNLQLLSATHVETKTGGVGGGGYFFLDDKDFTIVGKYNLLCAYDTTFIDANTGSGDTNSLPEVWTSDDLLKPVFGEDQNAIHSALPVWGQPNHYYVLYTGKYDIPNRTYYSPCGISVVKIIPNTSAPNGCDTTVIDSVVLPMEWNNNTFAVDETGAYFVTNVVSDESGTPADFGYFRKVTFDAAAGTLTEAYKTSYKNSGLLKPGQNNIGSGATPTLMNGTRQLAVITDNDSPHMNVLTYDRATGEEVTSTPVFPPMRGAGEASLIGVEDMCVVENNYGHLNTYPYSQLYPNEPGLTRIDLTNGTEANETWTDDHTSFLAMSMLARKTGCIFAHTADWSGPDSATMGAMYYINAIDAFTGRTIWRVPMGRGIEFCHDFGGIYFNREGSLFVGTANYLVSVQNE